MLKDFVFNKLPHYYRDNDTNKDVNGEGVLQRYLQVFGLQIDDELKPFIDGFQILYDVSNVDPKFLQHIGSILGYPPSLNADPELYRKILLYIIQIYKVKGTCMSFKMLFNLLGLQVEIIEDIPRKKITYDLDPEIAKYDHLEDEDVKDDDRYDSECDYCSGFSLAVNSQDDECNSPTHTILTQTQIDAIGNIICFLTPINATYHGLVPRIKMCEVGRFDLEENTEDPSTCAPPHDIHFEYASPTLVKISWQGAPGGGDYEIRFRLITGGLPGPWVDVPGSYPPDDGVEITIIADQIYEFEVRHACKVDSHSPWVNAYYISKDGLVNITGSTLDLVEIVLNAIIRTHVVVNPTTVPNNGIADVTGPIPNGFYDSIQVRLITGTFMAGAGTLYTGTSGTTAFPGYEASPTIFQFDNVTIAGNHMAIVLT